MKLQNNAAEPYCVICFDHACRNKLIRPCKCKGSGGTVHEKCLQQWITSKDPQHPQKSCEICKYPYRIQLSYENNCFTLEKFKKNPKFSLIFFLLLAFLAGNLTALSLVFRSETLKNIKSVYLLLVLFISVLSICIFSCSLDILRRICFDTQILKMKIFPYNDTDTNTTQTI